MQLKMKDRVWTGAGELPMHMDRAGMRPPHTTFRLLENTMVNIKSTGCMIGERPRATIQIISTQRHLLREGGDILYK
eukprot:SAG11_NODE_181_length_13239_cov_10.587139_7_plen_77_part_00